MGLSKGQYQSRKYMEKLLSQNYNQKIRQEGLDIDREQIRQQIGKLVMSPRIDPKDFR